MAQYGAVTGDAVNFGVQNQDAVGGMIQGLNGITTVAVANDPNAQAALQNAQAQGFVNTGVQDNLQMTVQNQAQSFDPLAMGNNAVAVA